MTNTVPSMTGEHGWSLDHNCKYPPGPPFRRQLPDLTGEPFGMLTVVRLSGQRVERRGDRGREWECVCECGRPALRTTGQLNYARKNGHESMCDECRDEWYRGVREDRKGKRPEQLLKLWEEHNALYHWLFDDREADELREGFAEADLGYRYDHEVPLDERTYTTPEGWKPFESKRIDMCTGAVHRGGVQRSMGLFPLKPHRGYLFRCKRCRVFFRLGFGCGFCLEPICRSCIGKKQHRCHKYESLRIPCSYWDRCPFRDVDDFRLCERVGTCKYMQAGGEPDWICVSRAQRLFHQQWKVVTDDQRRRYVELPQGGVLPLRKCIRSQGNLDDET